MVLDPLFRVEPSTQIILDTIKPAEDNDNGKILILRLYEAYGAQAHASLKRYV